MSDLKRIALFLERGRPIEAETEARGFLAREPQVGLAHAFLAQALLFQLRFDEAEEAAREAVHLAPQNVYILRVLAMVLNNQDRNDEALCVLDDAVQIDPSDPLLFYLKALIHLKEGRNGEALNLIETALSLDPEDADYHIVRARILNRLNRPKEAEVSAEAALRLDPDNAGGNTEMGWALLRRGKTVPAGAAFRDALRNNPDSESARVGIVEALKARFPLYRWILAFFFWMQTLSKKARWGVILGLYFGVRILRNIAEQVPQIRPFVFIVLGIYVVFVFLTWTATPLCNLFLRLHPLGRHALTKSERTASNWIGGLLLCCLVLGVAGAVLQRQGLVIGGIAGLVYMIPLSGLLSISTEKAQRKTALLVGGIGLIGLCALVGLFQQPPAYTLLAPYLLGCFFYSFLHHIIADR
ncbi:MAG: tetratricopeptide repeat protein [Pontiellaceae bacterium]|nr:tetratricopeptide repeat protein [Pontiellaceae bacterium]